MKKLRFQIEAVIRDRYKSASLTESEVREWLLNMQKPDILKVETENEYWEDIPQNLFEMLEAKIKDKKYEYTMAKGHLWLEIEISIEAEPEGKS